MSLDRFSGVLLHISSLPSSYGIGDLGTGAYKFVDILVQMRQKLWQILPLNTVDGTGSPYKSFSAFACSPLLIDPEDLKNRKLIDKKDLDTAHKSFTKGDLRKTNYAMAATVKEKLLRKAFERFDTKDEKFFNFKNYHAHWLHDWALFASLSRKFDTPDWGKWPVELRDRHQHAIDEFVSSNQIEIEYHKFVQFIFIDQWFKLKSYANSKGVSIVGDIPIFVSLESCDVWSRPWEYNLDHNKRPWTVAGCPPDYFSATGQMWGNPHYRWDEMRNSGFYWWKKRFELCFSLYNFVRVDHFRGFEAYWEIPASHTSAIHGKWVKAPGFDLFHTLRYHFSSLPIIVEDLGTITNDVHHMRDYFGFPGTKVIQFSLTPPEGIINFKKEMGPTLFRQIFGYDDQNVHLPRNYPENAIVYTGTHDNNPVVAWFNEELDDEEKNHAMRYFNLSKDNLNSDIIRAAYHTRPKFAVVQLQDILGLGSEARMNTPGKIEGNWSYRFLFEDIEEKHILMIKKHTEESGRE